MTDRAAASKRPASRGPRCAHLDATGQCPFAGGRCIDGSMHVAKSAQPFFCNFFKRKPARRRARKGTDK
jgi:hypothetical protein